MADHVLHVRSNKPEAFAVDILSAGSKKSELLLNNMSGFTGFRLGKSCVEIHRSPFLAYSAKRRRVVIDVKV